MILSKINIDYLIQATIYPVSINRIKVNLNSTKIQSISSTQMQLYLKSKEILQNEKYFALASNKTQKLSKDKPNKNK